MEFPVINPVAIAIGPLKVHWYGLMYMIGFAAAWWLGTVRAKRPNSGWTRDEVGDLVFYGAMGVILGGRLGYVFFYNFSKFLADPVWLVKVWDGGMSFHGGAIGVLVAFALFARKTNKGYFEVADFMVPMVPIGLATGRFGNFINAELWGRVTDVPWGVVFPGGGPLPRHPSQLYEAALEGLVLFVILYVLHRRNAATGVPFFCFFIGYGLFRFLVEFVRQPDAHLGFLWGGATMGQLLSLPMIFFGLAGCAYLFRQRQKQ